MKYHAYIFADGSSSKGGDIGAWASVACSGDKRQLLYGVDFPTTISRCELRPILEALRWVKTNWATAPGFRVLVISDSQYTVMTLAGVYDRHKNLELWQAIDEASKDMDVKYVWRERNSLPYMTLCDAICGPLRRRQIDHMKTVARDPRKPEADMPFYPITDLEDIDEKDYDAETGVPDVTGGEHEPHDVSGQHTAAEEQ